MFCGHMKPLSLPSPRPLPSTPRPLSLPQKLRYMPSCLPPPACTAPLVAAPDLPTPSFPPEHPTWTTFCHLPRTQGAMETPAFHRIIERFGLEWIFNGHLVPAPLLGHLQLDQVAQSPIQPDLECFQGWGIYNLSGQHVPVFHHPHGKKFLPYIYSEKRSRADLRPWEISGAMMSAVGCRTALYCRRVWEREGTWG